MHMHMHMYRFICLCICIVDSHNIWRFPEIGVPQIIDFNGIFHCRPSILETPIYFIMVKPSKKPQRTMTPPSGWRCAVPRNVLAHGDPAAKTASQKGPKKQTQNLSEKVYSLNHSTVFNAMFFLTCLMVESVKNRWLLVESCACLTFTKYLRRESIP